MKKIILGILAGIILLYGAGVVVSAEEYKAPFSEEQKNMIVDNLYNVQNKVDEVKTQVSQLPEEAVAKVNNMIMDKVNMIKDQVINFFEILTSLSTHLT